ncbi:hypothetical protein [Streptomyces sp. 5-10]|uniref:hypothetical protein n=1 Tax=Streptomyces sp. 5-10 TaxID=878925 RepID=UPI00168A7FC3|nr:hypothetical protein [Streptomyces sp. 5-10]MBD3004743.1 hypothetical protein [Streptomyces sp. 5-10]
MNETHEKVAEELEETEGWIPDSEHPNLIWTRRMAKWSIINDEGSSVLSRRSSFGEPGYEIPFGPNVPHFLIIAACAQAGADCQKCGTSCEGDCNIPDVTVNGEVI